MSWILLVNLKCWPLTGPLIIICKDACSKYCVGWGAAWLAGPFKVWPLICPHLGQLVVFFKWQDKVWSCVIHTFCQIQLMMSEVTLSQIRWSLRNKKLWPNKAGKKSWRGSVGLSVTWMDLCEQECAGAALMELQDEESVWAEPVDEGLLCWNWEGQNKRMVKDTGDKF